MYLDRVQPSLQAGSTANSSGGGGSAAPSITEIEVVSATAITVRWGDLSGDQAYIVQRSTDGTNYSTVNTTANNVTSYADTGLTASTKYYYRVAVSGTMDYSNVVSGTTPAAGGGGGSLDTVSTFAAASGGTTQIDLTWVDSSDEAYYIIERSTDGGTTYDRLTSVAGGSTSYSDTGLSLATQYHYRICAFDDLDASSAWAEANATTDAASAPQTGLTAWYKAEDYDSVNDEWPDANTPGQEFVKDSGTSLTEIADWDGSGQPALSFASGSQYSASLPSSYSELAPGQSPNNQGSIYVVFRLASTPGGNTFPITFEDESTPASVFKIYVTPADKVRALSDRGVGNATLEIGDHTAGDITTVGVSRAYPASSQSVYAEVTDQTAVESSLDASGSDAANLDRFVIDEEVEIAEILFYGDGTEAQLGPASGHHESVMTYLNSKYGVA